MNRFIGCGAMLFLYFRGTTPLKNGVHVYIYIYNVTSSPEDPLTKCLEMARERGREREREKEREKERERGSGRENESKTSPWTGRGHFDDLPTWAVLLGNAPPWPGGSEFANRSRPSECQQKLGTSKTDGEVCGVWAALF